MRNIVDYEDKHKGIMAFIIGAGPSLHTQDISGVTDYVTFAVNSGILKLPYCDYFVTDDVAAADWNWYFSVAKNSGCTKFLFKEKLDGYEDIFGEKFVWFDHVEGHNPDFDENNLEGYFMTKDASKPLIGARTSAGTAVHLAFIMGCDPIVLLGCDACHRHGKRYFWQFPGERKAVRKSTSKPVYCYADQGKRRNKPVDQHCCDFDAYWSHLAEVNKGRANIIYASEGGLIEAFQKMTLKEVMTEYVDRKNDKSKESRKQAQG